MKKLLGLIVFVASTTLLFYAPTPSPSEYPIVTIQAENVLTSEFPETFVTAPEGMAFP